MTNQTSCKFKPQNARNTYRQKLFSRIYQPVNEVPTYHFLVLHLAYLLLALQSSIRQLMKHAWLDNL